MLKKSYFIVPLGNPICKSRHHNNAKTTHNSNGVLFTFGRGLLYLCYNISFFISSKNHQNINKRLTGELYFQNRKKNIKQNKTKQNKIKTFYSICRSKSFRSYIARSSNQAEVRMEKQWNQLAVLIRVCFPLRWKSHYK